MKRERRIFIRVFKTELGFVYDAMGNRGTKKCNEYARMRGAMGIGNRG